MLERTSCGVQIVGFESQTSQVAISWEDLSRLQFSYLQNKGVRQDS